MQGQFLLLFYLQTDSLYNVDTQVNFAPLESAPTAANLSGLSPPTSARKLPTLRSKAVSFVLDQCV